MSKKIIAILKWIGIIYRELFLILVAIAGPALLISVTVDYFIEGNILFGSAVAFLLPAIFCVSALALGVAIEVIKDLKD